MKTPTVLPIVYVWTGTGSIVPLEVPVDLTNPVATPAKPATPATPTIESFDNLRRTNSSVNQYIEIPKNNMVSTRRPMEKIALFRFRLEPNKSYKLNIQIRARTDYKFAVPILARYYLQSNNPAMLKNFRSTYVSSGETVNGAEKTTSVFGTTMLMVVDNKLSVIRITAEFITGNLLTELTVHHGIKTDDPDATLYCLEGSNAILSEIVEI